MKKLLILLTLLQMEGAAGRPETARTLLRGFVKELNHGNVVDRGSIVALAKTLGIKTAGLSRLFIGSALLVAAEEGYVDAAAQLFALDASDYSDVVLGRGAQAGQLEVVVLAVEHGAIAVWSALSHAAGAGHLEVVKWLVREAGVPPEDGEALRRAAAAGQLEVVKWLLTKAGVKGRNWAVLDAVVENQLEVVRWLIVTAGATNLNGALRHAVRQGSSVEMLNLLVELGAEDDATIIDGALYLDK